jgi:hypothetical protein
MSQGLWGPPILDRETSPRWLTKVALSLRLQHSDSFSGENGDGSSKSDHSRAGVSSSFTRIVNTPYQVENEAALLAL